MCAEFGYRSDEEWCYAIDGSAVLDSRSGSPCQDLTLAGTMKGVLGLTGMSSRLFFILLPCCGSLFSRECRIYAEDALRGFLQIAQFTFDA